MFFSLDQLVTKSQILNTKSHPKSFVVISIQRTAWPRIFSFRIKTTMNNFVFCLQSPSDSMKRTLKDISFKKMIKTHHLAVEYSPNTEPTVHQITEIRLGPWQNQRSDWQVSSPWCPGLSWMPPLGAWNRQKGPHSGSGHSTGSYEWPQAQRHLKIEK